MKKEIITQFSKSGKNESTYVRLSIDQFNDHYPHDYSTGVLYIYPKGYVKYTGSEHVKEVEISEDEKKQLYDHFRKSIITDSECRNDADKYIRKHLRSHRIMLTKKILGVPFSEIYNKIELLLIELGNDWRPIKVCDVASIILAEIIGINYKIQFDYDGLELTPLNYKMESKSKGLYVLSFNGDKYNIVNTYGKEGIRMCFLDEYQLDRRIPMTCIPFKVYKQK